MKFLKNLLGPFFMAIILVPVFSFILPVKQQVKQMMNIKAPIAVIDTNYEVKEMNFPATNYVMYRQKIKLGNMSSFFSQHFPQLYREIQKANAIPGIPSSLFFTWDEKNQLSDMAVAVPFGGEIRSTDTTITTINIPASKALYTNYYGPYDKIANAYNSLNKYLTERKLKQKMPSIEQYLTNPQQEKDSTKWLTKIIYLVE